MSETAAGVARVQDVVAEVMVTHAARGARLQAGLRVGVIVFVWACLLLVPPTHQAGWCQNGPHAVLGKENFVVTYNAGEIAKRLGNALVAPTLAYVPEGNVNPPSGHMRYPGSITLPEEAYIQVLLWAGRSFKVNGSPIS